MDPVASSAGPVAGVVVLSGLLAFATPWSGPAGAFPEEGATELRVTSGADAGRGTLREALFEASRARGPVTVRIDVDRVTVRTPLPPLTGAAPVEIRGRRSSTVLDADGLDGSVLLDVDGGTLHLRDLAVAGAREACLRVQQGRVAAVRTRLERCRVAVDVLPDGTVDLDSVEVAGGDVGVRVDAAAGPVRIHRSAFSEHATAGVRAVGAAGRGAWESVEIRDTRFEGARTGVMVVGRRAVLSGNEFLGAGLSAIHLGGTGARVENNRIRDCAAGIEGIGTRGAVIAENEIAGSRGVGILLKDDRGSTVRANRLHGNGYGMVVVLGPEDLPSVLEANTVVASRHDGVMLVGASPHLHGNAVVASRQAGLRILDYLAQSGRVQSRPVARDNRVSGSGVADTERGVYREGR